MIFTRDTVYLFKFSMKPFLAILFFMVIAISGQAQEICDNAIDDDNNGLIDLKDPSCSCNDSLPNLNYLGNPSFEKHGDCPPGPTQGLGQNNSPDWVSAPNSGQVGYFNSDCPWTSTIAAAGSDSCSAPLPIPDGKGFIALRNLGTMVNGGKHYAATCPLNTLRAGQKYVFEGFVGGTTRGNGCVLNYYGPFTLTLFGNPDCAASDFTVYTDVGCPLVPHPEKPYRDWEQLGSATVYTKNVWEKVHIEFTPRKDLNLFLVGPDCVNAGYGAVQFIYADNFSLSEKENFAFKTITVTNDCVHDIQLKAPPAVNATYQWYKDSIAIIGATNPLYTVSRTAPKGNYNVRLVFPYRCLVSTTVSIDPDVFKGMSLGNDTTLCIGESLRLHANIPALQYQWQDGSSTSDYIVKTDGNYELKMTDGFGCSASTTIKVNYMSCTNCPINVPSAFSPNNDGKNDLFKVLTDCSLVRSFSLGIYNRWGQKIFETKDINKGWDGMLNGKPSPIDTYVYKLQYTRYSTIKAQQAWGTITLIR